uniref:VTT domain-containing protein n=1 Tax=Polytomella parva TaxID=51329 RepID=A0A7S0YCY1_9CHLO|mmetsp:Transcript_1853/g.2714  ORF Transcript_1853/g.2714 Transcript_1853/m.2714 type:complete len:309 (+) Transcript_1853:54-980(+)
MLCSLGLEIPDKQGGYDVVSGFGKFNNIRKLFSKISYKCSFFGISGFRLISLILFVVVSVFSLGLLKNRKLTEYVLLIQEDPYGLIHIFTIAHIVGVVILFPAMLLQMVTGALYGMYLGFFVSWAATAIGQALAFVLGRYLLRKTVKSYLSQTFPNFPVIDAAIRKEGWKLICLLRLSPILPYNVLNYASALTPISFVAYTVASTTAIIPWTLLYVYLGTFTTSIVDLLEGNISSVKPSSASGFFSSAIYLIIIILTTVYGYVLSQRAINNVLRNVTLQVESSNGSSTLNNSENDDRSPLILITSSIL